MAHIPPCDTFQHSVSQQPLSFRICEYVLMLVCVCVCEGHTLKPAALKCALAADCKVESDNPETMHRQRLT